MNTPEPEERGARDGARTAQPRARAAGRAREARAVVPADAEEQPVFLSLEEEEEDFQLRAHTPLADEERLRVERVLDVMGMSPDEVALVGRLVLHEDVYTEAADLIALSDEVIENTGVAAPNDMSADDIATLDRLYSPPSGGNCNYVNDYQTIQ